MFLFTKRAIADRSLARQQYNQDLRKAYEAAGLERKNYENTQNKKFLSPSRLQKFVDVDLGVERSAKFKTIGTPEQHLTSAGAERRAAIDSVAAPIAGIAGAAALASPALLPVAAAAGIGYGAFKLGESLKIW